MTATTDYELPAALDLQPGTAPGTFSVTNRDATHSVIVTIDGERGSETCYLVRAGDSVSCSTLGLLSIRIESILAATGIADYPARIMLVNSNLDFDLEAAPILGNDATTPIPVINV